MKNKLQALGVIALLIFGGLFTQSCEKIKDAVAFDVEKDMPVQSFELDSADMAKGELKLMHSDFLEIDLEKIFDENDIDAGKISKGEFKSITLDLDEDVVASISFGFVSAVEFKLGFNANEDEAVLIAKKEGIDKDARTITFDMQGVTLDDYISAGKFYYFVYGVQVSEIPSAKLALEMRSKIGFTVSPLK